MLLLSLTALAGGCLKEPQGPTRWDIQVATPLGRDSIKLSDFDINLDSTLNSFYDSLGILTVGISDSLPSETLSNIVDLPDIHDSASINLREAMVTDIDTTSLSLPITDLVPGSIVPFIPDSGYSVIPPFSNMVDRVDTAEGFHWARINSGILYVSVGNYLPIYFDTISISFSNSLGEEIISLNLGEMLPMTVYDTTIRITDVWVDSIVGYSLNLISSGSRNDTVFVTRSDSMVISFSLDSLVVDSIAVAGGHIKGSKHTYKSFHIEHDILVDTLSFSSGTLNIALYNYLSFAVNLGLVIPEFRLDTTAIIFPDTVTEISISLPEHPFIRLDPDSNSLSADVFLDAEIPRDTVSVLRLQDSLGVRIDLIDAEFHQASVTFGTPYTDTLTEDTLDIGEMDIPEGVNIEDAIFHLKLISSLWFTPDVELNLVAHHEDGDSLVLPINLQLMPGTPESPGTTDVSLNVADLINFRPDYITWNGTAEISGRGSIYENSAISGWFSAEVPFILSIEADTIQTDTFTIDIDDDFLDVLFDSSLLKEIMVVVNIRNMFPFGFSGFKLVLLDTLTGDSLVVPLRGSFPAAPVDSNGIPIRDTSFADTVLMDSVAANFLGRANSGYGVIWWNNIERAAVFRDSRLNFGAYGHIKARVDIEKMAGGE